ncbi:MAG TPA: methionine--tRNA ligase subunit beta [Oligoflexia bacterium]|nr:methionine--tRNA ligase subunit beta [Oligoflexia bacterium]HMP26813.1 methionine--tRNA ligase subunit beta [Oligoflexia bacterium]
MESSSEKSNQNTPISGNTLQATNQEPSPSLQATSSLIEISDFAKIKLIVGQIKSAEKLPKSNKLLRLIIDLGETLGTRQVLSGIAKYYQAEDLINKKVVIVANLKPAFFMGETSEGMLLAACPENEERVEIVTLSENIPVGSIVR